MAIIIVTNNIYMRLDITIAVTSLLSGTQDINGTQELIILTNVNVDSLCKLVRLPGGMVPNLAGHGAQFVTPYCGVSIQAITNLKLACYFIHHQTRNSWVCTPAIVILT